LIVDCAFDAALAQAEREGQTLYFGQLSYVVRSTTILTEIPAPIIATSNADCVAIAVLRIAFIAALFCCDDGI